MNDISFYINELEINSDNKYETIKEIYPLFAKLVLEEFEIKDFKTKLVPYIYKLIDENVIQKDLIYLSLLANQNYNIIKVFIEHEQKLNLNVTDSSSLFNYCYYRKEHWFDEFLNDNFNIHVFNNEIRNFINILRLIKSTNNNINIKKIEFLLEEISTNDVDEFLNIYVEEIKYIKNVFKFCKSDNRNVDNTELFQWINNSSLLGTFSKYLQLSDETQWVQIIEKLCNEKEHNKSLFGCSEDGDDITTFHGYTILFNIIKCVKLCRENSGSDIMEIINKTEILLCNLKSQALQIQLLEDIFAVCFLRNNHFNEIILNPSLIEVNIHEATNINLIETSNINLNETSRNFNDLSIDSNGASFLDINSDDTNFDVSDISNKVINSTVNSNYTTQFNLGETFNINQNEDSKCLRNIDNSVIVENKTSNLKSEIINIDTEKLFNLNECNTASNFYPALNITDSSNKSDMNFICTYKELRMILMFLKSVLDCLRTKKCYVAGTNEYLRFQELSKYIVDALWRLEIVTDVKGNVEEKCIINYMLAEPDCLINLCLKKEQFERAHQVIQIFSLHETNLAKEISFTENLNNLRASLKKSFKMQEYQNKLPHSTIHNTDKIPDKVITHFYESLNDANAYNKEHKINKFYDILDITITLPDNFKNTKELLAISQHYLQECDDDVSPLFYQEIVELFTELGEKYDLTICQILNLPQFYFDTNKYRNEVEFYKTIFDTMNIFKVQIETKTVGHVQSKHVAHKTFLKLSELINARNQNINTKYMQRLFNYLKSVMKLFYIEGNNTDIISKGKTVSYFEILTIGRTEIFGKLIFERNLDPQDFEPICTKLKIDLLYHTISNCFPYIPLNYEIVGTPTIQHEPLKNVVSYAQKRNWLLAFILIEMNDLQESNLDVNKIRTKYFTQFIKSKEINNLKILFANNNIKTALARNYVKYFMDYLNKNVFYEVEKVFDPQNDSLETAEEISEDDVRPNWKFLLEILQSIPQIQANNDALQFSNIKDRILSNLIQDQYEPEHYKYVQFITNPKLREEIILNNFRVWPGNFCVELLKSEVSKFGRNESTQALDIWWKQIEFCEEVKYTFDQYNIWFEVHQMCIEEPELILEKLLTIPKVQILLNFIDLYSIKEELFQTITADYMILIFESKEALEDIKLLFHKLPMGITTEIAYNLLKTLRNIDQLQFIIDYLLKTTNNNIKFIRNVQISLKILNCFSLSEQDQLWCLINEPLSVIEILLMNIKLDKLGQIMDLLKPILTNCEDGEEISIEAIDDLLRKYAEKSLDFRVITQPHSKLLKTSENKLMESLDSIYGPDKIFFIMPESVPTKSEWVANNEVLECMCCQNIIFSMFNRRHHCRRCGRVICFNCSLKRMQVLTYEDILVRVCIDCYDQTHIDGNSSTFSDSSSKSIICDYWLLTESNEHNAVVREEFSYEHAPSVSLFLSVMKYHSKTIEYPKFLLDQCDNLLKLLQPVSQNASNEIDYMLVIKMLKSLAVAAKMLSSECHLQWGTSLADRILSQADLLGLLAERGCLNLLPASQHNSGLYVDASILRRLRDKLLKREQWNFALEVSTKAGLDNAGVFAAWGKSCLKAGCLQLAREKFQRCLDKTAHYDFSEYSQSMDLDDSYETTSRTRYHSKISTISETKPLKDPPLLNEIIRILESKTTKIEHRMKVELFATKFIAQSNTSLNKINVVVQSDPAICILNKLKNLEAIAAGNYYDFERTHQTRLEQIFFEECIYYLSKYGSHLSLLQFYLKHDCLLDSLLYIIHNRVSTDVFIDVYMICLKDGVITSLQECMSTIDSTLDTWKDYLRQICRHLEKQSMLNSLYQLQQFMGDFVRAAMTCIRFYKDNAKSYKELASNVHFLYKAQDHLKQDLEQEQWVEVNSVRKLSTGSKNSFEEKALANPSLVMKVDSRNIDKHINTINRQIEITKFLAQHENEEKRILDMLPNIGPVITDDARTSLDSILQMPTLFDDQNAKLQLAVLAIVCGENVDDGYGMAYHVIHDYKLKPIKVYCQAGRQLAKENRYTGIAQLVSCIRDGGVSDSAVIDMCDEMLSTAVRTLDINNANTSQLECLIKLITDRTIKISIYIETKQLKSAYLLAAKHNRIVDIRRILREAELLNKPDIKKLCQRILQSHSHSHKDL